MRLQFNNSKINNNTSSTPPSYSNNSTILAFSLLELSIVLISISILTFTIFGGSSLMRSSKTRQTLTEVKSIETALYAYYASYGNLPYSTKDGDYIYFSNNCQVWKELYDHNILINNKIEKCNSNNETRDVIEAKYSNLSKDKSKFYAIGFNKNLLRNTIFLLPNNEKNKNISPETIDTLENISHHASSIVKKTNYPSISNEIARDIDIKSDDGKLDSGRIQSFSAKTRGDNNECTYDVNSNNRKDINCTISFGLGSLLSGDVPGCMFADLPTRGVVYDFIGDIEKPISVGRKYSGNCKEHFRPRDKNEQVSVTCVSKGTYGAWEELNPCRRDYECKHTDILSNIKNNSSLKDLNSFSYEDEVLTGTCDKNYYVNEKTGDQNLRLTCINNDAIQGWYYGGITECKLSTCSNSLLNDTDANIDKAKKEGKIEDNEMLIYAIKHSIFPTTNSITIDGNTIVANGCDSGYSAVNSTSNTTQHLVLRCERGMWKLDSSSKLNTVESLYTYNFRDEQQKFTIPELNGGQAEITFELWGAEGGGKRLSGNTNSGLGGLGGYVKANLKQEYIQSGNIFYIYTGGYGGSSTSGYAYGGYNGGGSGYASGESEPGNGGGGATDVRYDGTDIGYNTTDNRILVAGGGGGGGEDANDTYTHGGDSSGITCVPFYGCSTGYGDGGGGGGGYMGGSSSNSSKEFFFNSGADTQGGYGGTNYISTTHLNGISNSSNSRKGSGLAKVYLKMKGYGCLAKTTYTSTSKSNVANTYGYYCFNASGSNTYGCKVYFSSPNSYTITVPNTINSIWIKVYGGKGGYDYGGNGGYSYGKLSLSTDKKIYVYVGGSGSSTSCSDGATCSVSGGYNGGGSVNISGWYNTSVGSGGGATDVRYGGNALSNRKIVAGGGGGGVNTSWISNAYSGGSGGGGNRNGGDGQSYDSGRNGKGGTQSTGYALGSGESASKRNCSGAGGGYYGGKVCTQEGGAGQAAGGGSGYIGGVTNGGGTSGVNSGGGYAYICWGDAISSVDNCI